MYYANDSIQYRRARKANLEYQNEFNSYYRKYRSKKSIEKILDRQYHCDIIPVSENSYKYTYMGEVYDSELDLPWDIMILIRVFKQKSYEEELKKCKSVTHSR